MQHERRIGKLLLDRRPIHDADAQQVASIICEAAAKDGLSMFSWTEEVERLQRRVAQVAEWHSELHLPDVSTPHLLATAHEWLPLYLTDGGRMRTSATELKRIDLAEAIWNAIPYPLQQEIRPVGSDSHRCSHGKPYPSGLPLRSPGSSAQRATTGMLRLAADTLRRWR